jgi:hypothetical protein
MMRSSHLYARLRQSGHYGSVQNVLQNIKMIWATKLWFLSLNIQCSQWMELKQHMRNFDLQLPRNGATMFVTGSVHGSMSPCCLVALTVSSAFSSGTFLKDTHIARPVAR